MQFKFYNLQFLSSCYFFGLIFSFMSCLIFFVELIVRFVLEEYNWVYFFGGYGLLFGKLWWVVVLCDIY